MNPKDLLNYFQKNTDAITDSIKEIVEIESPSYDVAQSKNVVNWIEKEISEILPKAKIERIFKENYGEHLIIRAFNNSDKKPILLLGHTDTVHPVGTKEKTPTRIENGKLFGCGTFDMKANIALMLHVFKAMKEFGLEPRQPINVLLSCDEEIGSDTGRELVEQEAKKAAYCYVFEPSANGKVKTGRKGTGMYRVTAQGIPAHAGLEPEKGISAILEISRQVPRLHFLEDPDKGTTVNVCKIRGGTATNVIPEFSSCDVDVRFKTMDEAERVDKEIKQLKRLNVHVSLEIEGGINRPPLEKTGGINILLNLAQQKAKSFGYKIEETQVGGASDGNFVGALGVPVLDGLGIAGDGAHTLEEFVYVEDIPKRATLLTLLLSEE